jgi:hypothetical protein
LGVVQTASFLDVPIIALGNRSDGLVGRPPQCSEGSDESEDWNSTNEAGVHHELI